MQSQQVAESGFLKSTLVVHITCAFKRIKLILQIIRFKNLSHNLLRLGTI